MLPEQKKQVMDSLYDVIRSSVEFNLIVNAVSQGVDPSEIYNNPGKGYNGNLLHAHASVLHSGYGDADHRAVRFFLECGVNINALNDLGQTPLHIALAKPKKTEAMYACIDFLIANGADINLKNLNGDTPLHIAMKADDWRAYNMLVSMNADTAIVDAKGNDGTKLWRLLSRDKVGAVSVETAINYRLTEVFNFSTKLYTCISHNISSKVEAITVQPFDALSGSEAVEQAYVALRREGGTAEYIVGSIRKPGL